MFEQQEHKSGDDKNLFLLLSKLFSLFYSFGVDRKFLAGWHSLRLCRLFFRYPEKCRSRTANLRKTPTSSRRSKNGSLFLYGWDRNFVMECIPFFYERHFKLTEIIWKRILAQLFPKSNINSDYKSILFIWSNEGVAHIIASDTIIWHTTKSF